MLQSFCQQTFPHCHKICCFELIKIDAGGQIIRRLPSDGIYAALLRFINECVHYLTLHVKYRHIDVRLIWQLICKVCRQVKWIREIISQLKVMGQLLVLSLPHIHRRC